MTEFTIGGNLFSIDLEQTRAYYTFNGLCDCDDCLRFQREIKRSYPLLSEFLAQFGVDISRPDETAPIDLDGQILYLFAGYTVCGSILHQESETLSVTDGSTLAIGISPGFEFPNGQTGAYFSLSVYELCLPRDKGDL